MKHFHSVPAAFCNCFATLLLGAGLVLSPGPLADVYSSTLDHVLAPSVLRTLKPRFLSNLVYAVASAPADIRAQHVGPTVTAVLPVLLQERKLHACNAQVGSLTGLVLLAAMAQSLLLTAVLLPNQPVLPLGDLSLFSTVTV